MRQSLPTKCAIKLPQHHAFWRRMRRWILPCALVVCLTGLCGCKTWGYYAQAAKGQYQILARQERIDRLLASSSTPEKLRERLELLLKIREFADQRLHLPVNGHYRKYADLGRPYVVWNVEAAPEFSMEPKSWWYPLVGRLEYRGFFKETAARKYGDTLQERGYDVSVGGVTAYSTLGWFKDPALNTFIFEPELDLAETVFHELAHQEVFAGGDKDFNEAFATLVGREGVRLWLAERRDSELYSRYEQRTLREDQFAALVLETRQKLEVIYGDIQDEKGNVRATSKMARVPHAQMLQRKHEILEGMRHEYEQLKAQWNGDTSHDGWFARPLNNARLNALAAYHELVPGFRHLLKLNDSDLKSFYGAVRRLANMNKEGRHHWLRLLSDLEKESPSEPTDARSAFEQEHEPPR